MRRRPPRALLGWCGAGLAALLTVQTVATDLAALHARARRAGPEVDALVVVRDVALGERLDAADVAVVRRHARHLPPESLRAERAAVGRVVRSPLLDGSVVTDRHLAARDRTGLDGVVPPGMRAVRVPVEGTLVPAPGSVVDVLVTFDPSLLPRGHEPTSVAVRGALVVAAEGAGVTLLTDPGGAARLAFAAASGVVTLALAPPEEAQH